MNQKFKPILFSTEMVQAILEGRKTQTRRVCKHQFWQYSELVDFNINKIHQKKDRNVSSKYQIDDILWVRETFAKPPITAFGKEFIYKAGFDRTICGWKPSIHMPKEAARIFLKVTDVRCERLCSISEEDAIAEGIEIIGGKMLGRLDKGIKKVLLFKDYLIKKNRGTTSPVSSFFSLWKKINGEHSYHKNPWVWVYTFEKIEKPENFLS